MSEDVSSQVRLGATIILVAALIAAVLSLMVVAQQILNNGMSTLQAGVDRVQLQEYEKYNNKKVSGTDVKSAMSLYSGKDVSICIRTSQCIESNTSPYCYIYGSIISKDSTTAPSKIGAGDSSGASQGVYYISESQVKDPGTSKDGVILWRNSGDPNWTSYLWTTNGKVEACYITTGTEKVSSPEYILDSARFNATLIKAPGGTIIGIIFEQLN